MYSHTHTHPYTYSGGADSTYSIISPPDQLSSDCLGAFLVFLRCREPSEKTYKLLHSMFSTLTLTSHFLWQAIRHTGENRRKTRREILTSHFIKISQTSRRNPNTAVGRESWHFVEEVWNKARGSFRFQSVCSVVKVKYQLLLAAWCSPLSQT